MRSPWRAALLCLAVVAAVLAVPGAAHGAPSGSTFGPVADGYTDAAVPSTTFGTKSYLYADADPVRVAYLRFDVQNAIQLGSATLRLYAENANSAGFTVHRVADTSWGETTISAANAPAIGPALAASGRVAAGTWVSLDVAAAVSGNGPVGFALVSASTTALKVTSREGAANWPELVVGGPPANPSPFVVSPLGGGRYVAESASAGTSYTGSLKHVGESAVADLAAFGGGTVRFTAGEFDFGAEFFKFHDVHDIVFEGAGTSATTISNSNSTAADTEPFNFSGTAHVTVRDLTVAANGAPRTTSDALDFDKGNDSVVERVRVTASRGRGIVFDGKDAGWTSAGNVIRDCVITGTAWHGIELLAATDNRVEGCVITATAGTGIQLNKSSPSAAQPNKKASANTITGNTVEGAGRDGIAVNGGDRNTIIGNTVTNSADDVAGKDGIRIGSADGISCDDNVVSTDTATDTQSPKTQRYGVYIATTLCNRTVLGPGNSLGGNLTGPYRDLGTGTILR